MSTRVDRDDVSVVGEVTGPGRGQVPVLLVEHADGATLGGDVKTLRALIVGEDIGLFADRGGAGDLRGRQIDGEQRGITFAGDEGQPSLGVEREAVAAAAPGQLEPAGDGQSARVDGGEIARLLHGDQHLVGNRVVDDVADLAAEVDAAADLRGDGVDDGLGAAGFVGGPHRTAYRVVRDPVPAQIGNDEDAVRLRQTG